eukprot:g43252.t1
MADQEEEGEGAGCYEPEESAFGEPDVTVWNAEEPESAAYGEPPSELFGDPVSLDLRGRSFLNDTDYTSTNTSIDELRCSLDDVPFPIRGGLGSGMCRSGTHATRPPERKLFKVIMLGPSDGGKTSIMGRYTDGRFPGSKYKATIGSDFRTKTIQFTPNQTVTLQIWDTAGQERFRALGTAFYRGADGLVLVYDTSRRDLDTASLLETWYEEFREALGLTAKEQLEFPLMVLGNKLDLVRQDPPDFHMHRKATLEPLLRASLPSSVTDIVLEFLEASESGTPTFNAAQRWLQRTKQQELALASAESDKRHKQGLGDDPSDQWRFVHSVSSLPPDAAKTHRASVAADRTNASSSQAADAPAGFASRFLVTSSPSFPISGPGGAEPADPGAAAAEFQSDALHYEVSALMDWNITPAFEALTRKLRLKEFRSPELPLDCIGMTPENSVSASYITGTANKYLGSLAGKDLAALTGQTSCSGYREHVNPQQQCQN